MKRLYLIDGSSLAYRSFFAFIKNPLRNSKGQNTSAIFGFVNSLLKLLKEARLVEHNLPDGSQEYEYACVVFDLGGSKARIEKFKEYKATRKKMPYELSKQIPIIEEIIQSLGIKIIEKEGIEADDIIGSIAENVKKQGFETIIFSQDKDFLQLVDDRVKLLHSKDFKFMNAKEKLGIPSEYVADFLGLCGDTIDNIPGVPGIGPKTAVTLINSYGSIEQILDKIDNIKSQSLREILKTYGEQALFSKELATIDKNIDIEQQDFKIGNINREKLFKILRELELLSIMKKFETTVSPLQVPFPQKHKTIPARRTSSLSADRQDLAGGDVSLTAARQVLKTKEQKLRIASYLLRSGVKEHSLDYLALEYLGRTIRQGETANAIFELEPMLKKELEQKSLYNLFMEIEIPLSRVLSKMEKEGILIDKNYFELESKRLEQELEDIKEEIYKLAGMEFNINSPKQVGYVLFEKLKLPKSKKTKTGYSTSFDVLLALSRRYPLPLKLLSYRELFKLKSTYIDAIPRLADSNNRIHTTFNQTVTATGRLSSTNPNLQNIPKADIRKGFIAPSGYLMLCADYSQIELRILASISGDKTLKQAFEKGIDIHKKTAIAVFNVSEKEVTPEMRKKAKVINFGIVYGMGPYGLAKELGCSTGEAGIFINSYFLTYPGVKSWIEESLKTAREREYTTTILGRRRDIEGINSEDVRMREFEERVAINAPIQGSAADMIKLAMINIDKVFSKQDLKSKMLLQVHDELIFEVAEKEVDKVKEIVKTEMENALKLDVPVVVDIGIGKNWHEAH